MLGLKLFHVSKRDKELNQYCGSLWSQLTLNLAWDKMQVLLVGGTGMCLTYMLMAGLDWGQSHFKPQGQGPCQGRGHAGQSGSRSGSSVSSDGTRIGGGRGRGVRRSRDRWAFLRLDRRFFDSPLGLVGVVGESDSSEIVRSRNFKVTQYTGAFKPWWWMTNKAGNYVAKDYKGKQGLKWKLLD